MDSFLPYQNPTVTDKKLDSESLAVGANTVERERVQIAGHGDVEVQEVKAANPAGTEYGGIVRNIPYANTAGGNGRKTVSTPGTQVVLGGNVPCKKIIITALQANQNIVCVGFSGVVAGADQDGGGTRTGIPLFPSNSITLEVSNLNLVYLDAVTAADGVSYSYLN